MERHFVLPVALSASAHVALLFGFPSSPPAPKPVVKDEPPIVVPLIMRNEEPEPVAIDTDSGGERREVPDVPRPPVSPEPVPRPDVQSDFPIKVPQIETTNISNALKHVPLANPSVGKGNGVGRGGVIPTEFLDNPPRARLQTAPLYPHQERKEGVAGEVLVEFVVDEGGRVLDPRVVKSSHRGFEEATLRAVAKWRFEPGRRDGRIVRFRMSVPVVFNLNE